VGNDDGRTIYLTPNVAFEKSFDDLDVYVEGDYTVTFDGEDPNGGAATTLHGFYLEEELDYNLHFGEASTLTLILYNELDFLISPETKFIVPADPAVPGSVAAEQSFNALAGVLDPGLKFTQAFDFGDLYGQFGFPIGYGSDRASSFGLEFIVGYAAGFGLGVEVTCNYGVKPDAEYSETDLLLSYENGPIYGEVEIAADGEFKVWTITPEFDFSFSSFTAYIGAEFGNLGDTDAKLAVSPFLGISYSF
jgi:hypothetical protein